MIPDLANAHVLLVEDNDDDALLFSYCCRQINNSHWRIDHSRTYDEARSMIEDFKAQQEKLLAEQREAIRVEREQLQSEAARIAKLQE